jgi:hypothetical protein
MVGRLKEGPITLGDRPRLFVEFRSDDGKK